MKKIVCIGVIGLSLPALVAQESVPLREKPAENIKQDEKQRAKVQIAILLDSSGSMGGLINQARAQLWDVVNTFIDAKVGGAVPYVEVSLYTHGQSSPGENKDYIRQIQPLTRDLDQISADLFDLNTSGSVELCGAAISRVVRELKWDANAKTYKAIFIAGNESFKQGTIDSLKACKEAIEKGIIVNTIYCGDEQEGVKSGWKEGAAAADGEFSVINQHLEEVKILAPQDQTILELNRKLNSTYVTFNSLGKKKVMMQESNDLRNESLSYSSAIARACSKASANYYNASWDLVDASSVEGFDWASLKEENLPEVLKGKTIEQRKAWVAQKKEERKGIQEKIKSLNSERLKFIDKKRKELAKQNGESLDTVIQRTVKEQATRKGYTFDKK